MKSKNVYTTIGNHLAILISANSFMYLLMFYQMSLLSKRLRTDVTPERFLPRMSTKMDLYIGFVQETSITNTAPMHRLLFP